MGMEASVFQLIPKVAGPGAEMRMGWGRDTGGLTLALTLPESP